MSTMFALASVRRSGKLCIAAACLGLLAPGAAWAQASELQVSYSTDSYLTCDSLNDEIARMDAIIAQRDSSARLIKTANERKKALKAILQTKTCGPAKAKDFGPGMYN